VDTARHFATALLLEDARAILNGDGLRFRLPGRHTDMDARGMRAAARVFNIFFRGRKIRARLAVFAIEKIAHRVATGSVGLAVGGRGGVLASGVEQDGQRLA
jgi:hypothetical protein